MKMDSEGKMGFGAYKTRTRGSWSRCFVFHCCKVRVLLGLPFEREREREREELGSYIGFLRRERERGSVSSSLQMQ
ncbi:unnamed protein product [Camellia sinensis]